MALILKSNPSEVSQDNAFTSDPVWIYQRCMPQRGDEVFIWTSETAGGDGLAARGTFLDWSLQRLPNGYPGAIVRVSIAATQPSQRLTIADLKPYSKKTNPSSAGPLRTLCDKLLIESRNKIALLRLEEVERLRECFGAEAAGVPPGFPEGSPSFRRHLARERNTNAVRTKKANAPQPLTCEVCDFRFSEFYNEAEEIIDCHHLLPLGAARHRVTTLDDLILVCANCHRVVHKHIRNHPDDPRNLSSAGLRQAILRR
jgi:hypothetical protein